MRTGTGSSSGSGVASGVMHSASGIAPCRSISRDDGRMPSVERIARGVQLPRSRTCGAAARSREGAERVCVACPPVLEAKRP